MSGSDLYERYRELMAENDVEVEFTWEQLPPLDQAVWNELANFAEGALVN